MTCRLVLRRRLEEEEERRLPEEEEEGLLTYIEPRGELTRQERVRRRGP